MKTEKELTFEALGRISFSIMEALREAAVTPETLVLQQIVRTAFEEAYLRMDAILNPVEGWEIPGVKAQPQVIELLPKQLKRILDQATIKNADTVILCDDGSSFLAMAKNCRTNSAVSIYTSETLQ